MRNNFGFHVKTPVKFSQLMSCTNGDCEHGIINNCYANIFLGLDFLLKDCWGHLESTKMLKVLWFKFSGLGKLPRSSSKDFENGSCFSLFQEIRRFIWRIRDNCIRYS